MMYIVLIAIIIIIFICVGVYVSKLIDKIYTKEPIEQINNKPEPLTEPTPSELNQEIYNLNIQLQNINKKLYTQNRMLDKMTFYFGMLLFLLVLPTIIKIFAALCGANILTSIL